MLFGLGVSRDVVDIEEVASERLDHVVRRSSSFLRSSATSAGLSISDFVDFSNTTASDIDNLCEIEDSEVNSEFEN